jgi:hypothetical protein
MNCKRFSFTSKLQEKRRV